MVELLADSWNFHPSDGRGLAHPLPRPQAQCRSHRHPPTRSRPFPSRRDCRSSAPQRLTPTTPPKTAQRKGPARGGRLGNAATRAQNAEIAAELKDQGYTITGGGGEEEEEYIEGKGPGTKGGTFVDITAVNETTGKTVRIQTIDTLADA